MRFILRDSAEKKQTPIYFVIRKNRKGHQVFLKYATGISITPDQWNENNQRVRELSGIPHQSYNQTLEIIERTAKDIFRLNNYFDLTPEIIRYQINKKLKRPVNSQGEKSSFYGYFDAYIERYSQKRGKRFVYSYGTVKKHLIAFSPKLNWQNIDYDFYTRFIGHLERRGYSKNYIGKDVNAVKIVLSEAVRDGLPVNQIYHSFKVPKEEVDNIYLTEGQLEIMYQFNELKPYQKKARDLFLIGCYTGMRVENYLNIDPDVNVDLVKNRITVIVNKNGPRVTIPIHWIIREIIDKYNGLPESISPQKLNKYIKEVGKLIAKKEEEEKRSAEFSANVILSRTVGGKRTQEVKKTWELITSHTARRSMITNLWKRQIPLNYIMQISGHKTESQCLRYIKAGYDELEEKVGELDFWNK